MDNKKAMTFVMTVLVLATISFFGLSYAYYRTKIIPNPNTKSISVVSKKLEIVYGDGNGIIEPNELIEPGWDATKTFTVENTGDETVSYGIIFDNVTNTFTRLDWEYTLTKVGDSEPIASGLITTASTQVVVPITSIASGVTDAYELYIK